MNFGLIFGNAKSRLAGFAGFPWAQGESRTKTVAAATPAVFRKVRREESASPCARFFPLMEDSGRFRRLLMVHPILVQDSSVVALPQRHANSPGRKRVLYMSTCGHTTGATKISGRARHSPPGLMLLELRSPCNRTCCCWREVVLLGLCVPIV